MSRKHAGVLFLKFVAFSFCFRFKQFSFIGGNFTFVLLSTLWEPGNFFPLKMNDQFLFNTGFAVLQLCVDFQGF
jgi:hypothetical protein